MAKFHVGQIVVDDHILPKVLGVVLRNRKTGQYGVVPFYLSSGKPHTDLRNWREQNDRERKTGKS